MTEKAIIKAENVTVSFGDFQALKGINAEVKQGEIIVILGPSGSGKSTFIRTLNQLQPHDGGRIEIDGIEVGENTSISDMKMLRTDIGFVFQNFSLLSAYPVWYNVLLPLQYRQPSVPMDKSLAVDYLAKVGLADYADHYASMLYGGQKQRVSCARSLIV